MSTPVAVAGAFVGLWARGLENNVYAQIGMLMLIGLSAKNAILIVEFAKAELENGASLVDAALNGARKRLRPILMTSFAFIFGLLPLWNALGAGGGGPPGDRHRDDRRHDLCDGRRHLPGPCPLRRRRARVSSPPGTTRGGRDAGGAGSTGRAGAGELMIRTRHLTVALLVLCAGCSATTEPRGFLGRLWRLEVGPDYERPAVDTPEEFRGEIDPAEAASFADLPWWEVFGDPALQQLVRDALAGSYDLQGAVARIEQARALVGVSASQLYPQVGYQGAAARQRIPGGIISPGISESTFNVFLGAFNVAWEIDLWGRIRRTTEVARAQFLASEEARRGVVVTLVSDVATGYFQLLALDRELAIAHDSAETYRRTRDVFMARYLGGTDTKISTLACRGRPPGQPRHHRRAQAPDHPDGERDQRAPRRQPGADRARHGAG